ncbi:MAG: methyl-accepting chemotaxis protein [Desulfonatronovibrio sp.]|nr:methyl-accepting chemotaxis protein [Desulfovibrionales bacterium]
MKNIHIRIKLLGGFLTLLILVCAGLGYIAYDRSSSAVLGQVQENIPLMARDGARLVENRVDHHLTVVESVANNQAIRSMNWNLQKKVIEDETKRLGYLGMGIISPRGQARYPDGSTADLKDRGYFKEAMQGSTVFSDMIISRVIDRPVFIIASPIRGDNNRVQGVLLVRADGAMLSEITDNLGYGASGYSYIIDGKGALIAHENRDFVMDQRNFIEEARNNPEFIDLAAMFQRMIKGEAGFDEYNFVGTDRFFGYAPIEGTDWSIAVGAMKDDVFAPIYAMQWAIGIASLIFFGAGLIVALIISRSITSPVNSLMRYADAVAKGDLEAQSEINQKDEMGRLAKSISSMVENLKDKSYWYETILDAIPFPISVTDMEMRWTFINKAAVEVTGKRREEVIGKQCQEWGADICGTDRCGIECLKRGQSSSFFTQPGLERDFQVDVAYLTDRMGTRAGHIEIVQDVTEANKLKRQAEQALKDGMNQAAASIEGVVERMTSASEELSAQVEESSRGAEEQKSRTAETATAMEEMNATVLEVAKNASSAAQGADQAREKAYNGADVVSSAVEAINQVSEQAGRVKSELDSLGSQAEQIGKIMTVIEDIADQTNLLALNAAIEAARAGDAGRGFAVVADEVRKLAEKTMNATKEVGQSINSIQEGTRANIDGMDKASELVGNATDLANKSGEVLKEIVVLVEEAADQVRSIATATEEQSAASEEVNRSIDDVNRISVETSDVMNQSAMAISELAKQATELQNLVEQLKQKD